MRRSDAFAKILKKTHITALGLLSFTGAALIATVGVWVEKYKSTSPSLFLGFWFLVSLPGLTIAALVGGALGIGTFHDPSLVLAWIANCVIYFSGLFFILRSRLKSKA